MKQLQVVVMTVMCVVTGRGLWSRSDRQATDANCVKYGHGPSRQRTVQRRQNTAENWSRH